MLGVQLLTISLLSNLSRYYINENLTRNFRDFAIFSPNDTESLDIANEISQQTQKHLYVSGIILSVKSPKNILKLFRLPFLVFCIVRDDLTTSLDPIEGSIDRFQQVKIIFILTNEAASRSDILDELFSWCWKFGVFGVVAAFPNPPDLLYSFEPFPHMMVIRVHPEQIFYELFRTKTRDHHGTALKRAMVEDFPRSFSFIGTDGKRHISGYVPKFYATFIEMMNASMVDVVKESGENMNLFEAEIEMSEGRIDLATFLRNLVFYDNLMITNPLSKTDYYFLVPFSKSVAASAYVVLPFSPMAWIGILVAAIFIAISEYIYKWTREDIKDFGRAMCNAILGLSSQSLPSEPLISWPFRYMRIQVIVLGFMLTNFYLALLSSFMTTTVYEPQMKTPKDIRDRGQKLLSYDLYVNYYNSIHVLPEYSDEIVQGVDKKTYYDMIFTMNGSYGLGVPSDDGSIILYYQSFLKRPIFYVPGLFVSSPYTGTLIRKNSSFALYFEDYILHVWASGLRDKWQQDSIVDIIKYQFEKKVELEDEFTALNTENLIYISIFFGLGMTAAIICFLAEILLKYALAHLKYNF